jgi:hypothetical protein
MLAGIDKISLTTKEFLVKDVDLIDVDFSKGPNSNHVPLFKDALGREVVGKKAWFNSQRVNVDINGHGMSVSFNPSKTLHPYHLLTDVGKIKTDILRSIEKEMAGKGLITNLHDAELWRLDLTKQDHMNQPVYSYANAFGHMKLHKNTKTYPEGFYITQKQWTSLFYNKGLVLKDPSLVNFMRAEQQFTKKPIIQNVIKVRTLNDLLQTDAEYLTSIYNPFMIKKVFSNVNHVGQQLALDINGEAEILNRLREKYPRTFISKYLNVRMTEQYLLEIGGISTFVRICEKAGISRSTIYSYRDKMARIVAEHKMIFGGRDQLTVFDLLNEVRQKFAA